MRLAIVFGSRLSRSERVQLTAKLMRNDDDDDDALFLRAALRVGKQMAKEAHFAARLGLAAGLRNILVHEYAERIGRHSSRTVR